jgi:alanine racemase
VNRVSVALQRRSGTFRPPTLQTLPAAVTANVVEIRARTRSTIMAVVKADGYGHGAVTVARAAVAAGAGWLGTTSVAEASALRAARLAVPILTWLHPTGIDAEAAADTRVDVAVGSVDELGALVAHAVSTVRVHLHVDTGMSRAGCPRGQWDKLIGLAQHGQQARRVRVVGVMGHLPLADRADPAANAPAVARMHEAQQAVRAAGLGSPLAHLAATSGTVTDPATHLGMVRVGAGLVGIDPSGTVEIDVALLGEADGRRWASPPLEIQTDGLFDTQSKYDGSARFSVPADIDSADRAALTGALRMFDALGCTGVARIDFFLTDDGPVLNEVKPCRE